MTPDPEQGKPKRRPHGLASSFGEAQQSEPTNSKSSEEPMTAREDEEEKSRLIRLAAMREASIPWYNKMDPIGTAPSEDSRLRRQEETGRKIFDEGVSDPINVQKQIDDAARIESERLKLSDKDSATDRNPLGFSVPLSEREPPAPSKTGIGEINPWSRIVLDRSLWVPFGTCLIGFGALVAAVIMFVDKGELNVKNSTIENLNTQLLAANARIIELKSMESNTQSETNVAQERELKELREEVAKFEEFRSESLTAQWGPLTEQQIVDGMAAFEHTGIHSVTVFWGPDVDAKRFFVSIKELGKRGHFDVRLGLGAAEPGSTQIIGPSNDPSRDALASVFKNYAPVGTKIVIIGGDVPAKSQFLGNLMLFIGDKPVN
jgi:hypothetical protein